MVSASKDKMHLLALMKAKSKAICYSSSHLLPVAYAPYDETPSFIRPYPPTSTSTILFAALDFVAQ